MKSEDGARREHTRGDSWAHAWTHMYKHTGKDMRKTCIHTQARLWIFYVQIIKERWLRTEKMHCCSTWTTTDMVQEDMLIHSKRARDGASFTPSKEEKKNLQTFLVLKLSLSKGIPSHTHTFQQVVILSVCLSFSSNACLTRVTHSCT